MSEQEHMQFNVMVWKTHPKECGSVSFTLQGITLVQAQQADVSCD